MTEYSEVFTRQMTRQKKAALLAVLVFFVSFGTFSYFAEFDSGVYVVGTVSVENNRTKIQHDTKAIIKNILVQEGDIVKKGSILITLDDIDVRSKFDQTRSKMLNLLIRRDRIYSSEKMWDKALFSKETLSFLSTEEGHKINQEKNIFQKKQAFFQQQQQLLKTQQGRLHEERQGRLLQIKSLRIQAALLAEETADVQYLFNKGLTAKPRLLALRRKHTEIDGAIAANISANAAAQKHSEEIGLQILNFRSGWFEKLAVERRDIELEITLLREDYKWLRDQLDKTIIRAPEDGTVFNLAHINRGSVVSFQDILLEIIPRNEKLIVNCLIPDREIEGISEGLPVKLFPHAFSENNPVELRGTLRLVSRDALKSEKSPDNMYSARIELDQYSDTLLPGMQVDLVIIKNQITLFNYLIAPLKKRFNQALYS